MASSAYTARISSASLDMVSNTLFLGKNSLDLEDTIGVRGVAKFTVYDVLGTKHFYKGQPVEIRDSTGFVVYSGVVDSSEEKRETFAGAMSHKVACVDNAYYADKRVAAKAYTNQNLGTIVDDLAGTYLAAEGIIWGRDNPILTRASIAYYLNGGTDPFASQVTSGNPRFEAGNVAGSQAIRIEEGTTNLLTANQSNVETNTTGFNNGTSVLITSGSTITRDTAHKWEGAAALKIVTAGVSSQGASVSITGVANTTYTASVWLDGTNGQTWTVVVRDTTNGVQTSIAFVLGADWARAVVTVTTGATASPNIEFAVKVNGALTQTVWADGWQIEAKKHATSFITGGVTRSAETLKFAGLGGIHPKHGTLQFRAYFDSTVRRQEAGTSNHLFGVDFDPVGNGGGIFLFHSDNTANWVLGVGQAPGVSDFSSFADSSTPDGWHRIAIAWDYLSILIYVDGTLQTTINNPHLPNKLAQYAYLGSNGIGGNQVNTLYQDFRISSRKRTASEISADAALSTFLPADIDTALLSTLNGVLDETGTVPDGPTIVSAIVNYAYVSVAFDKLAEKAGMLWNIDANKLLRFYSPGDLISAVGVTGSIMDNDDEVSVTNAGPLYRNTEYVPGGTEQTSTQVEIRKGDGQNQTFPMSFQLAKVPTVETNIASAGYVTKTVGINGVETGKDFYWSEGSTDIVQDSGGTKLNAADLIRVTYVGQYPITYVAQDSAEVTANQALEGGFETTTGLVESVDTAPTSANSADAAQIAAGKLGRYAHQGRKLKFKTRTAGLRAGTIANVTLTNFALAGVDMLIQNVRAFESGMTMYYEVEAIVGPVNSTWLDFFSNLVTKVTSVDAIQVGAAGTLVLAAPAVNESWTWSESVSQAVQTCLIAGLATLCGTGQLVC